MESRSFKDAKNAQDIADWVIHQVFYPVLKIAGCLKMGVEAGNFFGRKKIASSVLKIKENPSIQVVGIQIPTTCIEGIFDLAQIEDVIFFYSPKISKSALFIIYAINSQNLELENGTRFCISDWKYEICIKFWPGKVITLVWKTFQKCYIFTQNGNFTYMLTWILSESTPKINGK